MATIVTRAGKGAPLTNTEVDDNFTNLDTDKLEAGDALGTPASVTLTNATGLPTAGLVDNAVTDPKLRDSAGLSVMGRGANSTGDPADIVAGTNKQVLRREGSNLAFGAVDLASNQAVTGTLPVNQGGTGITSFGTGVAAFLGTPSSANLAAALTDETGTGAAVFATSPTLVTPALGTPSALVGTNITGTAAGLTAGNVTTNANLTGAITSTGNATLLGSFTSANLAAAVTDETGTGALVFANSPTLVTPALGTPASGVATNLTGTAAGLTAGNVTTNANLTGAVTSTGNATVLGSFSSANLAGALTDETGSGAAVFGTNPVIDGVTVPARTNPLAQAVRVAMTEAASGSRGWLVQDNPQVNFGTGDFTLHWEGSLPDWAVTNFFYSKNINTSAAGYNFQNQADKTLRLLLRNGSTTKAIVSTVAHSLTNGSKAKITASVSRETASSAGSCSFYVNGVALGGAVSIAAGAIFDIDSIRNLNVNGFDAARHASEITDCILYNRALSAPEVLSLCINGVDLADVGGSQVPVYESDFSAGTDGWIGHAGATALTGNQDGVLGEDDWLKFRRNAGSSGGQIAQRNNTLIAGKRNRVAVLFGNDTASELIMAAGNTLSGAAIVAAVPANTKVMVRGELIPGTETLFVFLSNANGNFANVAAAGIDGTYFKAVEVKQIGTTLNLSAQDAQSDTGQVLDSSGNGNHALLPAAGATVLPRKLSGEVRWTNTWAGTHELQYIGGVNQAILPANAYIESIVGTVSGATPHDIIIGDGTDADRYVTITTGLAAGTTSFALAARTTDGTNLKLTVDPDTNATMTIKWTIRYTYLEN